MKIGYARPTLRHPDAATQIEALEQAGCCQIFIDENKHTAREAPGRTTAIGYLREGDVLVVWRLTSLARSLKQLVSIINEVQDKGAGLQSVADDIDTTAPHGQLTFHLFDTLAEFERESNSERTKAGLAAARARGRKGGRPKGLSDQAQQKAIVAEQLYCERALSIREICHQLGISKGTLYNYLRHQGVRIGAARK